MGRNQNQSAFYLKSLILAVIATLFLYCPVFAGIYYVDKNNYNASNSNIGSENLPWRTIQKAADVLRAGDTVYVKNGIYNEYINVENSGTQTDRIVFKAFPGHFPVIDGSNINVPVWQGLFNSKGNDGITIDGFEVRWSDEALIRLRQGDYLTIRNCLAHGNSNGRGNVSGVIIDHSKKSLVEHNEVYDTGHNAITAESTSYTKFQYNYVHNNPSHNGINIFPKTTEAQVPYSGNDVKYNVITGATHGIYLRYQMNNEISNNLIYKNSQSGINIMHHPDYNHTFRANTKILNNTIVDNAHKGIHVSNATHLTIKNNLIAYCNPYNISIKKEALGGHRIDYNQYYFSEKYFWNDKFYYSLDEWKSVSHQDSHSLQANPFFIDRASNIYTLAPNSPAIDRGINLISNGITKDLLGISRPQGDGFDIGAYEFSGNTKGINMPSGLKVTEE